MVAAIVASFLLSSRHLPARSATHAVVPLVRLRVGANKKPPTPEGAIPDDIFAGALIARILSGKAMDIIRMFTCQATATLVRLGH
jgi:hypothetical protein